MMLPPPHQAVARRVGAQDPGAGAGAVARPALHAVPRKKKKRTQAELLRCVSVSEVVRRAGGELALANASTVA